MDIIGSAKENVADYMIKVIIRFKWFRAAVSKCQWSSVIFCLEINEHMSVHERIN